MSAATEETVVVDIDLDKDVACQWGPSHGETSGCRHPATWRWVLVHLVDGASCMPVTLCRYHHAHEIRVEKDIIRFVCHEHRADCKRTWRKL